MNGWGQGCLPVYCHHILNRSWYQSLARGKYKPVRILMLIVNILTLTAMVILMYSGITMSRHVFAFLPVRGGMAAARRLHILGSYWGFLLMSLHLGLHWSMVLAAVRRFSKAQWLRWLGWLTAAYGVYALWKRGLPEYLFLRNTTLCF